MLYLQATCPKLANPWKQKLTSVLCYLALQNGMDRRQTQQPQRQQRPAKQPRVALPMTHTADS